MKWHRGAGDASTATVPPDDEPQIAIDVRDHADAAASSATADLKQVDDEVHERSGWPVLAVLALGVIAAIATGSMKTVLVIAAFFGMIMVHEFGHFLTAKWSGMKVTEYFLGFGPRVWSFRRGETEYGVKAIPAGGYVRIIGMHNLEDVDPADESRTYRRQPFWRRVVVVSAGSFMHAVMAFIILLLIFGVLGTYKATSSVGAVTAEVNGTATPAAVAGLQKDDKIQSANGIAVSGWDDISKVIAASPNRTIDLTVVRGDSTLQIPVTPVDRSTLNLGDQLQSGAGDHIGFVGISPSQVAQRESFTGTFAESSKQMWSATGQVFVSLKEIFSPSGIKQYWQQLTGTVPDAQRVEAEQNRFISPVGLVGYANHAADSGIRAVLSLLFSINVFVGVFNMIPLLPFDGGHVAVAVYEKLRSLRGRRYMVDFAKLVPVSYAVVMLLLFIGLSAIWMDITNPLSDPF